MLILFDQGTPVAICDSLPEHTIKTAAEQGWSTLLNGDLLLAAEDAGFELFLTTDTNIPFQRNLKNRKLAIVVLTQNRWKLIRSIIPKIVAAIAHAKPGTCSVVEIPRT